MLYALLNKEKQLYYMKLNANILVQYNRYCKIYSHQKIHRDKVEILKNQNHF
jgi:hypothetical protein